MALRQQTISWKLLEQLLKNAGILEQDEKLYSSNKKQEDFVFPVIKGKYTKAQRDFLEKDKVHLDISVRLFNAMKNMGTNTPSKLLAMSPEEIKKTIGWHDKCSEEFNNRLKEVGLPPHL